MRTPIEVIMLDFFANYWPYILILVVGILLFFAIRGALKGLKARSPFNMENIRKSTEPNFLALQQKSKALLADADMVCEIKPGSDQVIPKKEDIKFFRRAVSQKFKLAVFQVPGRQAALHGRSYRRKAEIPEGLTRRETASLTD